jgi:septum formation protein
MGSIDARINDSRSNTPQISAIYPATAIPLHLLPSKSYTPLILMPHTDNPTTHIVFPELLLASKSPRRHQLLRDAGFQFDYIDIDADEDFPSTLPPEEICMFLAKHKSLHHQAAINEKVLVTADTIVYINNQVLNKPQSLEEAHYMLRTLSNQTHSVYTGVCLRNDAKLHTFYDRTDVTFHPLSDEQIAYYVEHFKPFDKAGSYGVQDWMGYVGVKGIQGCFYNVMGFPVAKFYRELIAFCQD